MGFSKQEYWSALPCPLPGDLHNPGIEPRSPTLQVDSYQLSHKGSPRILEWVAYPFSSKSSQSRNQTGVSCVAGRFFTNRAITDNKITTVHKDMCRTLVVQCLRLQAPNAGGPGSIPGLGTRSCHNLKKKEKIPQPARKIEDPTCYN